MTSSRVTRDFFLCDMTSSKETHDLTPFVNGVTFEEIMCQKKCLEGNGKSHVSLSKKSCLVTGDIRGVTSEQVICLPLDIYSCLRRRIIRPLLESAI